MATPRSINTDVFSSPQGLGYQFAEDLRRKEEEEKSGRWQSSSPDTMTLPDFLDNILAGPRGPSYDPSAQQAPPIDDARWRSTDPSTRTAPDAMADFIVDKQMEMNRNGVDAARGPKGLLGEVARAFRTEIGTSEEPSLPTRQMRGRPPVPGDKPGPPVPMQASSGGFDSAAGIPKDPFASQAPPKKAPPANVARAFASKAAPPQPTPGNPAGEVKSAFASPVSQSSDNVASVNPDTSGSASFEKAYNEELGLSAKSDQPSLSGGNLTNPFESEYTAAEKEWREATNDSGKWWVMLLAAMFPQFGSVLQMRDHLKEKKMLAARARYKDVMSQHDADREYERRKELEFVRSGLNKGEAEVRADLERGNKAWELGNTYDDFVTPDGTRMERAARSNPTVPKGMVTPSVANAKIHERSANRGYGLEERRLNQNEWSGAEIFEDQAGNQVKLRRSDPIPSGFKKLYRPSSENENSNMNALYKATNIMLGLPDDAGEDQRLEAYQQMVDDGKYTSADQAREDTENRAYQNITRRGSGFRPGNGAQSQPGKRQARPITQSAAPPAR